MGNSRGHLVGVDGEEVQVPHHEEIIFKII